MISTSRLLRRPGAALALAALPFALGALHSRSAAAANAEPSGTYVLTTAAGRRPPLHFALPMAGTTITGTVDSARVSLDPAGKYESDVVVRWENAPMIPMFGITGGRDPRTLHGTGSYAQQGGMIVLTPDDWMTRRVATELDARATDSTLQLVGASGGAAGNRSVIDVHFKRVR